MSGEDPELLENPIWWPGIIRGMILASILIAITIAWILYDGGHIDWFLIVLSIFMWVIAFWAFGLGVEFTGRPRHIKITESGVVLYYRYNNIIEEWEWNQIFDITIPKKKQPFFESGRDGCMGLGEIITKRRRFYLFSRRPIISGNMKRVREITVYLPTLIKVRDAFIKNTGKNPINLRENN